MEVSMNSCVITLTILLGLVFFPVPVRAEGPVTIRLAIGQEVVLIDLLDNPAAKAFVAQLPLTLEFRDYAGAEKIAALPARLSVKGSPSGREIPVDFAYYAPWGNLAVYYSGMGDDSQILSLGRIRTGKAALVKQRKNFTATLELLNP